jgi:hypothetical protein
MTKTKLSAAHEKYAAQVRATGNRCTAHRLGLAVGRAGDNLPSPYPPGSLGDRSYRYGLEHGSYEHKITSRARKLYEAYRAIHRVLAPWEELQIEQKWRWLDKAMRELS